MSILERIRRLGQTRFLDLTEQADTDEAALRTSVDEMENAVESAIESLAEYAAVYKRAEQEQRALASLPEQSRAKAEAALRAQDEAGARQGLAQKLKAEQRLAELDREVRDGRQAFEDLQAQVRTLRERMEAGRRRLTALQARGRAAAAQRTIGQHVDMAQADSDAFRKMESSVLASESAVDIERDMRHGARLDAALGRLDEARAIDTEMEALRKTIVDSPDTGH